MSQYQPPSSPLPPGQQPHWSQQPSQPLPPQFPQQGYGPQQPQYPPQQSGAFQQPSQKTRKPMSRGTKIGCGVVAAVVVLVIVIAAAASGGSKGSTTNPDTTQSTQPATQNSQAPAQPTATQKPQPTFAHFDDGTFQVGKDIQPGTYRTRTGSSNCYYARLKGFSGSTDDIIANDNTDAPAIVTIKSSDKGFESQGCGTWTKDLSQITASKTSFDDGMFIVGTDITPGTYRDTGGNTCYYARLSGFGGTTDDILANNLASAPSIVTISASDKGFQTKGCGTWKKQ